MTSPEYRIYDNDTDRSSDKIFNDCKCCTFSKGDKNSPIISFFFGAGAECEAFSLPSGAQYTLETMCTKRKTLYEKLKSFYKDRCCEAYAISYRENFLFSKNSHTFREIVYNAALKCIRLKEIDADSQYLVDLVNAYERTDEQIDQEKRESTKKKINKIITEKIYENIIRSQDKLQDQEDTSVKYKAIKENLSYYGAVEKDFSTIITPQNAGINRFWRLINYF